jgi:5'-nucleotidase (lipoprotein e(P4) family)
MKTYCLLILLTLVGCTQNIDDKNNNIPLREHSVQSVLWHQKSSEYKALCQQSFNVARLYFDLALENKNDSTKPLAVVTDIDETILDNSPFSAKMIEMDVKYTKELWLDWGKEEKATAIPGALEFFNYVASKNVEIFYLSNRYKEQKTETIANIKKLGFPSTDEKKYLLKDSTSNKQPRRDMILKDYDVVMYLGDNLGDFTDHFDGLDRNIHIDSIRSKLGFEFILLPNAMYGDWETEEVYKGKYSAWSSHQKDSIRKANLISF